MLQFAAFGLGIAVVNGICAPPRGVILRRAPELVAEGRARGRRRRPSSWPARRSPWSGR
ncbi:hypothetical protein [Sorangium sp. So ce117]|uniref:hypothetical protein n=1 Tax=Sorangium sp. So ce117 TaxID=3133277 RepID=UPI003F620EA4